MRANVKYRNVTLSLSEAFIVCYIDCEGGIYSIILDFTLCVKIVNRLVEVYDPFTIQLYHT
jgi:hypothetical protein